MAIVSPLAGCHPVVTQRVVPEQPVVKNIDPAWVGKSQDDLILTLGTPMAVLETAPILAGEELRLSRMNLVSYVYSSTRGDGCIDAYVVLLDTGHIVDYFCR